MRPAEKLVAEKLAQVRDELIVNADKAVGGVCMLPIGTVRYLASLLLDQERLARTNAVEEASP